MTTDTTDGSLRELQDLIHEKYGIDRADLGPEASMRDKGFDSLALVEFLFAVEDHFKISLPDTDENMTTLGQLSALVDELRAKKAAGGAAASTSMAVTAHVARGAPAVPGAEAAARAQVAPAVPVDASAPAVPAAAAEPAATLRACSPAASLPSEAPPAVVAPATGEPVATNHKPAA